MGILQVCQPKQGLETQKLPHLFIFRLLPVRNESFDFKEFLLLIPNWIIPDKKLFSFLNMRESLTILTFFGFLGNIGKYQICQNEAFLHGLAKTGSPDRIQIGQWPDSQSLHECPKHSKAI